VTMLLENNPYPEDVRVRSEAESLAAAGHDILVVAPRGRGQPRRQRINGVNIVRFRLPDGSRHGAAGFVAEYLVAGLALHSAAARGLVRGATVLHIHNPPDILFPAGALYRLAGRRVIFDHHDLFPETAQLKIASPIAARLARVCQRLTFAVAHDVLATNASYAELACRVGRKSLESVTVVRNGPPAAWTRMQRPPRGGLLNPIKLAYLGAISAQDGVDGLAPVLASVRRLQPSVEVHLTVIGDGDSRPDLERAFAEHGVLDHVTFTGRVPPAQVPELLQGVDACVDPAPDTFVNAHSTMTKIAEYLVLGKPVIAYDLLETRRTAAGAALLVSPGDHAAFAAAIVRIARDPEVRAELAGKARRRAVALTWEHSERALLAAYQGLRRDSARH
jgi:glycosyltransferase involved in cell wall biosynthesis